MSPFLQVVELAHGKVFSNYFAFLWPQITENGVLEKIKGPAIRLYLWLLVEQEERARRNEFTMRLTDHKQALARRFNRFQTNPALTPISHMFRDQCRWL